MGNKIEYINKYNKDHYKQFKAILKTEEMEILNEELNKRKMNKSQFIRFAINELIKKK